ncbi:methyl-accepting chemotaxis protein [Paenibacillus sp. N3/727]|uniref:methyl-accepting chemotaxis protein n=1 Tax=Paenibacillus sp. N3/727 TaxID=2925845 RepID=UPI001F533B91|nr:methyl-accepting chemotaxis protein [Paenibacillus sp. N3/727]UNK19184.1 methyl-accepting chemotaxis protein [Paenibacillus sp. N3/727]
MLKSLKQKMISMICLLLVLSLASVTIVSYNNASGLLEKSIDEEARLNAENLAREINEFIDTKIAKIEAVGKLFTGNKEEDLKLIQKAQETNEEFETFLFSYDLTAKNVIYFHGETTDLSDRAHHQEISKGEGKIVVSEPTKSGRTGNIVISLLVPLMKDGKQYGYIGSTLPIDTVQKSVSTQKFGETGYAFLVSPSGEFIWHPDKELILQKTVQEQNVDSVNEAFEQVIQGKSGVFNYTKHQNNTTYSAAYAPSTYNWGVFVAAPTKELHTPIAKLTNTLVMISVISLIVAIVIAYLFTERLVRPIQHLNSAVKDVAQGDLTKTLQVRGKDEVAVLSGDFNQTVSHLKHLIEGVNNSSNQVINVTEFVSSGIDSAKKSVNVIGSSIRQIADGATTHASGSEEIALSMSDMASGIVKIAETSSMVSEAAQEAAGHAETGAAVVEQTVIQIGNIGEGTTKVGTAIEQLSERSHEIEKILGFITEITSRIRLLSLNASIEAARAGEHGRGFAVVAEEVKKLAGQSEESTDKIAQIITEIREDTLNAVHVMEDSRKDVQEGITLIEEVREKFASILHASRNVAEHILEVSAASEEMSAGSEQVSASVEELKSIASLTSKDASNAATAAEEQIGSIEEISTSVQQLEAVVGELRKELSKFKV